MNRSIGSTLVLLALALPASAELSAQETGTPVFLAPYRAFRSHEVGGTLSFPENRNFGLEGFYTYGAGANDFGVRGGIIDLDNDAGTQIAVGGHFRTRVLDATERFPLDGALTVGVGAVLGDGPDVAYIPVGVTFGRRILMEGSHTSFVPFVHPIIIPTLTSDDSDVGFALGLGVDIRFSETFDLRVTGGVGDIEGLGIGLAFTR
jgi:hypothetical protein